MAVIPHPLTDNFATEPLSRSAARARLNTFDDEDFVVLFFGHLTRRKGISAFVQAAQHFAPSTRVRFLAAGQPDLSQSELEELRADCERWGVTLHEGLVPHDKVQVYFAAADCVAMPYLEGTTSAILKIAITFNKPVVATAIGDVPETIGPDSGVLISGENLPLSLATGILQARDRLPELQVGTSQLAKSLSVETTGLSYHDFITKLTGLRAR